MIAEDTEIVLVEGLFLLMNQDGWEAIAKELDVAVFIDVPLDLVREVATARKARTNKISSEHAHLCVCVCVCVYVCFVVIDIRSGCFCYFINFY